MLSGKSAHLPFLERNGLILGLKIALLNIFNQSAALLNMVK
jgi:hypothetical protein